MNKYQITIALALVLLYGCTSTPGEGPVALEPGEDTAAPAPGSAPTRSTAVPPDSDADAGSATAAPGGAQTEPTGQEVTPVVVDLGKLTPQPPAEGGEPREMPAPGVPGPEQPMVSKVKTDLGRRLDIDVSEIALVKLEEVSWPDSGLGCPEPGMGYMMVIVPGYQITLEAQGELYVYHTDQSDLFVLCEDGQPAKSGN